MIVTINVPRVLRVCTGGATELSVSATTVHEALGQVKRLYPALYRNVCDETGAVRRHINVFVNTDHVRERNGLETTLKAGDMISILPAVSGG
jgi:molybdopterin synthase sulfur carrier subunit